LLSLQCVGGNEQSDYYSFLASSLVILPLRFAIGLLLFIGVPLS